MGRANLEFTPADDRVVATPLPGQTARHCTAPPHCDNLASHRLVIRTGVSVSDVELLCDEHMVEWADEHGTRITTANRWSR